MYTLNIYNFYLKIKCLNIDQGEGNLIATNGSRAKGKICIMEFFGLELEDKNGRFAEDIHITNVEFCLRQLL